MRRSAAAEVLLGYTIVVAWLSLFVMLWSCPATAQARQPIWSIDAAAD